MTDTTALSSRRFTSRPIAEDLHALARAMIRQAQMLRDAGSADVAHELAGRARALNQLGWSYERAA